MTGMSRDNPRFSDDDIEAMARQVEPHDHDRIAAPPQVWNNIVAELEVELASSEASARARAQRRWFPSKQVLSLAAAALLIVGVIGALTLRNDDPSVQQFASAMMTDEGLQVATTATADARFVCDGDDCAVEVDLSAVPEAGEGDLELWVINGDVTDMHSLGVVTDSGSFDLPEGVSFEEFPIVDISVEPRDGVATHSGQSVLRGVFEGA